MNNSANNRAVQKHKHKPRLAETDRTFVYLSMEELITAIAIDFCAIDFGQRKVLIDIGDRLPLSLGGIRKQAYMRHFPDCVQTVGLGLPVRFMVPALSPFAIN